jgi:hypothetical protein
MTVDLICWAALQYGQYAGRPACYAVNGGFQYGKKKKDTYILETCVDRCAFSVAEDYLDLLQLKVGRI